MDEYYIALTFTGDIVIAEEKPWKICENDPKPQLRAQENRIINEYHQGQASYKLW